MKASLLRPARTVLGLAAIGLSAAAWAAAPPGHPSPDAAMQLLQKGPAPEMSHTGQVLNHMDANEYTYAEVSENGKKFWLAAPRTSVKDGDTVRFSDGAVMANFYSKLLKRTFSSIMFVDNMEVAKPR